MARRALAAQDEAQQRAFLQSIAETPDDDAPRLIYADWLDEHGDSERAEFIRIQCRRETLAHGSQEWLTLKSREAEMLRRYRSTWLGPWDMRGAEATFRRGFLSGLRIGPTFGLGLDSLPSILSPSLDLLEELSFHESKLAAGFVARLRTMPLRCLRRLECVRCVRGNTLIEGLAPWPAEQALSELVLRSCEVGTAGIQELAKVPCLKHLRILDLRENHFSSAGLLSLLESQALRQLEDLTITGSSLDSDFAPLFSLPSLRHYRLRNGSFSDGGIGMLIASAVLARLVSLELIANPTQHFQISEAGARELANSPHARQLTTLRLRNHRITEAGARELGTSPHLANLVCLDLGGNEGAVYALHTIAESPYMQKLVTLRLDCRDLYSESLPSLEPLLEKGRLPRLRDLVLPIGYQGGIRELLRERGIELTHHYSD